MSIRIVSSLIVGTLAACASIPEPNSALERARVEYELTQADPQVVQYAPTELSRTDTLLQETQRAWAAQAPTGRVDHLAYMTQQQAALARETAKLRAAESYIVRAGVEHSQAQLDVRTRQAEEARLQAALAQEEARVARENLETLQSSQRETELAAELARVAEQDRVLREELNAQDTDRGLVLVLNELRFAPNQATLQPGDNRSLDKLAQFLAQSPDRTIRIEGFTDNTGSDDLNQALSEQRAEAVRQALVERGVDPDRIEVEGFGKDNPVASNDDAAGRQMNRRVEIVILEDTGNAVGSDATGSGASSSPAIGSGNEPAANDATLDEEDDDGGDEGADSAVTPDKAI